MNTKLLEISRAAEKAAALQASAAEHQALAVQAQEAAAAEEAQAAELEEEAAALLEKSKADSALAASEQMEADELEAQSVAEEEQSVAHVAVAAADEVTFEEEMAEATADVTQAARSEARAHGEELGVGVCEFVPFLDIACDIVGTITAVGLEGTAAVEATKASGEVAAASAAKLEEERETAMAAEMQAKAGEDAAAAAEVQAEEVAETELAEEERVAGEAKEAQASVLVDKAEIEEETAAEAETEGAAEEEEAGSLAGDVIVKGVLACWDAIMASFFGLLSFGYFTLRTLSNVVMPVVQSTISPSTTRSGGRFLGVIGDDSLGRDLSYTGHHCGLFVLTAGLFGRLFETLTENSIEARGGIILCFAAAGALLQTLLFHSLPLYFTQTESIVGVVLHGIRSVISLCVLFTLEILLVWIVFGARTLAAAMALDSWVCWMVFALPLAIHMWFLERPYLHGKKHNDATAEARVEEDVDGVTKETDSLLPTRRVEVSPVKSTEPSITGWFSQMRHDLSQMLLPFELLMLACMFGLTIHCLSSTMTLWPASKALLLTTRPNWLLPLAVTIFVVLLSVTLIPLMAKCRKPSS